MLTTSANETRFESVSRSCGKQAFLAGRGNSGHDLTIDGVNFSLKTQTDKNIKKNHLHISKFMGLGKGQWSDRVADLEGLRQTFFKHMEACDRILSLRKLKVKSDNIFSYELVEIPKKLLLKAENGEMEICIDRKQNQGPATIMYMIKRKSENFNYILMMEHKRLERFS